MTSSARPANDRPTQLVALLLAIGSITCTAASPDGDGAFEQVGEQATATAKAGLFVVGNTSLSAPDVALRDRLRGLGYTLTIRSSVSSGDAGGKDLVVVSESVSPSAVASKFRDVTTPVIVMEAQLYDDMKLTASGSTEMGEATAQTTVELVAVSHPLAHKATIRVTSSGQSYAWGQPGPEAARIAVIRSAPNHAAIFGYERGAQMVGMAAPARRVGWLAAKSTATALTAEGWQLFDAAVIWAGAGAVCGDAIVQPPEQCDQGAANGSPSSACDVNCHPKCGNGLLDPGEQCDEGAAHNDGHYGGCNANCTRAGYCGDGAFNGPEQCDDGANNNGLPSSGCDVNCRLKCGNGRPDPGEQCDDGAANDGRYGGCNPNCTLAGYCGDGLRSGPEACDLGGNNQPNPYGPGLCTTSCAVAPYCGDAVVQSQFGEQCDGGSRCDGMCQLSP